MANPKKRVPENVAGDFLVDSTCIDCDACRQIAPSVFGEATETSFVRTQPATSSDRRRAIQALLSCPTGSFLHCQYSFSFFFWLIALFVSSPFRALFPQGFEIMKILSQISHFFRP